MSAQGVMAIVSKKVFAQQAGSSSLGDTLPIDRYNSIHKQLEPLAEGLPLFLVTAREGDALWLVAELAGPLQKSDSAWIADAANVQPLRDVSDLVSLLRFTNNKGITAGPGKLGMALQTPRALTERDVALLRGTTKKAATKKATTKKATTKKATTKKATTKKATTKKATTKKATTRATGALERLLAAWRRCPCAALGDAIDSASAIETRDRDALGGKGAEAHARWLEVAKRRDPADLERLLLGLCDGQIKQAIDRIDAILAWPRDPRLDRFIARTFDTLPFRAISARPFWTRLFKLLEHAQDPRILEPLSGQSQRYKASFKTTQGEWLSERLEKRLPEVTPQLAVNAEREPDDEARALLDELAPQLTSVAVTPSRAEQTGDELLAAVLEDPSDDEARLILADALLERGHPRGELIMLQMQEHNGTLDAAQRKRIKQLLKEHHDELLGPLAKVVLKKEIVFERGFLSSCIVKDSDHHARQVAGHPLWATVEHIEGPHAIFGDPVMRALRSVISYGEGQEYILRREQPWPIERLTCDLADLADARLLCECRALPSLRELELSLSFDYGEREEDAYALLFASSIFGQLERLSLVGYGDALHGWLQRLERLPNRLPRFTLKHDYYHYWGADFTASCGEDRRYRELSIDYDDGVDTVISNVVAALDSVGPKRLRQLTIRARGRTTKAGLKAIEAATKRHKALEQLEAPWT
jgi:uncharacterized protein (TIGR02996 family)